MSSGESPARSPHCAEHRAETAFYDCDGCRRALCIECARWTGRLMVCRHCGELAVPRGAPEPTEAAPAQPQRSGERGSLGSLLGYPLRGRQGILTAIVLVELALFVGSQELLGEAGCLLAFPRTVLLALIPGILGDVFRSTLAGREELDEWPDYGAPGARLRELFAFLLAGLYALVPAATWLTWTGCVEELARGEPWSAGCVVAFAVGTLLGGALWLPAFARVAATAELLGWLRVDEQLRLLWRGRMATLGAVAVCWLATLAGAIVRTVFVEDRLVAALAESLIGAYGAIVAARAAGLWARRVGFEA